MKVQVHSSLEAPLEYKQSGKQDLFRYILKSSASMYKSSDSQIFRTTTGIQLGPDTFNKSKLVMTFLTNLGDTEILHRFKSVIEGKTGRLSPNSSHSL